jgi:trehalose 6-phosphate phosphatase
MLDLLSRAHGHTLEALAHANVLLGFDYDGTLAPIVADAAAASMRRATEHLLDEVARLYPVVVISGRAQADLARRLRGIPLAAVVGNHGSEGWHASAARLDEVRRWLPALEELAARLPGVTVEEKGVSIALHYRRSREKKVARSEIIRLVTTLRGARVIAGKQVVNILPRDAPHKGIALERARRQLGCDTALYVGDDRADEDVFALDQPGQLLGVRVGRSRITAAPYTITDQRAIDTLLRTLLDHRRRRQPRQAIG